MIYFYSHCREASLSAYYMATEESIPISFFGPNLDFAVYFIEVTLSDISSLKSSSDIEKLLLEGFLPLPFELCLLLPLENMDFLSPIYESWVS